MATKIEITEDIRRQYGNAISQNQAKASLGMGNTQAAAFLADVPFMRSGRKKRYLAIDLARKIAYQQQTVS